MLTSNSIRLITDVGKQPNDSFQISNDGMLLDQMVFLRVRLYENGRMKIQGMHEQAIPTFFLET